MSLLAESKFEATTIPVEVVDFLDVSARYLGEDQFPPSLLYQAINRNADYRTTQS